MNVANSDRVITRILGVPLIDRYGVIKSVDIRKTWLNLYSSFIPDEMKKLEKMADSIIEKLFLYMTSGKEFDINVMEENLNEVYDKMFYMLCTGEENTEGYEENWKDDWDEGDDCIYVELLKGEKLFRNSLHTILFVYKTGQKEVLKMEMKYPLYF